VQKESKHFTVFTYAVGGGRDDAVMLVPLLVFIIYSETHKICLPS
jgi:hypothetical protein